MVKNQPANARDTGSIPGSGRFSGGGNGNHSNILAWKILCAAAESDMTEHIGIAWRLTVVGSVRGPFLVGKEPGSQSDPGQQAAQSSRFQ